MSIWREVFGSLIGGWKTYGPNSPLSPGAFAGGADDTFPSVGAATALKLSAVWACVNLRAEVNGTLPVHVRDREKNVLYDHPLYYLLHDSPNAWQTAPEFFSMCTAHQDLMGNSIATITRLGGRPVALNPVDPNTVQFEFNKSGSRRKWTIDGEKWSDDDVLHVPSFSMDGLWGISRLQAGIQILGAQVMANRSAAAAFKTGLKVGGFFEDSRVGKQWNSEELKQFYARLDLHSSPEMAGKFMKLPAGLKAIAGAEFRINPVDAQLLESRYFGIEEICRLFNVPPPLIGQTSKASSWASSLENINLHFLTYSLTPTIVRNEKRIAKKLLTPADVRAGIEVKFNLSGLLRGDMKTRQAFYASALQNGYFNRDEVRDLEDRGKIPGGDKYTVQTNMIEVDKMTEEPQGNTKPNDEGDDE